MLYISARLRSHALYTSPSHTCLQTYAVVIIIWQAQNVDPTRAYRPSKTSDKYVFSVRSTRLYLASSWSRALATAWSCVYCAITIMASST